MWGATPGLAATALRTVLSDKINIADQTAANQQREALSAILSIKPLSSRDWLSLSGMQLVTDQPMDDVLESLKLSTLTGPNEGNVMVDRGIYGVSLWASLSPDLKTASPMISCRYCFHALRQKGHKQESYRPLSPPSPSACAKSCARRCSPPGGFLRARSSKNWAFRRGVDANVLL